MKSVTLTVFLFGLIALAGCASNSVVSHMDTCCPGSDTRTFSVSADGIPAFLGPIMVSNFSVALASRGFQPVDDGGDLLVTLRYEQEDLTDDRTRSNFDERISPGGDVRFVARMVIEMVDTSTGKLVFRGNIHRVHDVSPGEFMHVGRASMALLEAFDKALAPIPALAPPEI
ncbi:MAG: DUF4136 domain-containing protein [Proteobacteria bacterium]|jgi:hypothetical protein|nr:DUF4136 domain-containing protein [Pseudomonadota bacterium]